jgi:hypothetical protein
VGLIGSVILVLLILSLMRAENVQLFDWRMLRDLRVGIVLLATLAGVAVALWSGYRIDLATDGRLPSSRMDNLDVERVQVFSLDRRR